MGNSKTIPPIRQPENHGAWLRKQEFDDYLDRPGFGHEASNKAHEKLKFRLSRYKQEETWPPQ